MLGWEVSLSEKKRFPPAQIFNSSGVKVDFSATKKKTVVLSNKDGRLEGIADMVKEILKKGTMGFKEALSLKGKLQFAEGQLFFRVAAPICRLLSRWASIGCERRLTKEMEWALESIEGALGAAGPRIVESITCENPVLVFTDGACESSGTTVGGVVFIQGMRPQVFGGKLSAGAVATLTSKAGQRQIIGQAEILPVLIAKRIWSKLIKNKRVIYFIDNDSARAALVKGYSPILSSLGLIMECAKLDAWGRSSSWYARVPSKSNIADAPSRMDASYLKEKFGALVVSPAEGRNKEWFSDTLV